MPRDHSKLLHNVSYEQYVSRYNCSSVSETSSWPQPTDRAPFRRTMVTDVHWRAALRAEDHHQVSTAHRVHVRYSTELGYIRPTQYLYLYNSVFLK